MTDHIEYRLCVMPSASTPQHEQYVAAQKIPEKFIVGGLVFKPTNEWSEIEVADRAQAAATQNFASIAEAVRLQLNRGQGNNSYIARFGLRDAEGGYATMLISENECIGHWRDDELRR